MSIGPGAMSEGTNPFLFDDFVAIRGRTLPSASCNEMSNK